MTIASKSNSPLEGIGVFRRLLKLPTSRMHAQRVGRDMLTILAAGLGAADSDDETEFRGLLVLAQSSLGMTQREFAASLMITTMTLQRWIVGRSLPTTYARRGILQTICEMVFDAVDQLNVAVEGVPQIIVTAPEYDAMPVPLVIDCDGAVSSHIEVDPPIAVMGTQQRIG